MKNAVKGFPFNEDYLSSPTTATTTAESLLIESEKELTFYRRRFMSY